MIPKIIHYCWFGGSEIPESVKNIIDGWRIYCPDFQIVEWNENNFDVSSVSYVKEAYDSKKWAFVSDYVRLYVLYEYGGFYFDTDVELISPIGSLVNRRAVLGFESKNRLQTGVLACEKGYPLFKLFLNYYSEKHFVGQGGLLDETPNSVILTSICVSRGLKLDNKQQMLDGATVYPSDVFCPLSLRNGKVNLTDRTLAIHHFMGSWINDSEKKRLKISMKLHSRYGDVIGSALYSTVFIPYRVFIFIRYYGVKATIKKIIKKMRGRL